MWWGLVAAAIAAGTSPAPTPAPTPTSTPAVEAEPETLADLSLEELLDVPVTIGTLSETKVAEVPAAVYVLDADDIRRSGATSVPEALRWVPGLFVSRSNSAFWNVGSRAFPSPTGENTAFLALVDGRVVNLPLFGGVLWNTVQPPLYDIDRIEVIRGPGSATWGANAVTGVINIVSKTAADTQGLYASVLGGNVDHLMSYLRYGDTVGSVKYRLYGSFANHGGFFEPPDGSDVHDGWTRGELGFRADWKATDRDTVEFFGSGYMSEEGFFTDEPIFTPPFAELRTGDASYRGADFLVHWERKLSEDSSFVLKTYYDYEARRAELDPPSLPEYTINTFDADARFHLPLGSRQNFVVGLEYRLVTDHTEPSTQLAFTPAGRTTQLISPFLEDRFTVVEDRLQLLLGLRLERNGYTGFEAQPTLRATYTPSERHTLWAAFSRAVRVPTRSEQNAQALVAVVPPATVLKPWGNPDFDSETLLSYDFGYRTRPIDALSFDLVGYVQDYAGLAVTNPLAPIPDPDHPGFVIVPLRFENGSNGQFYGAEVSARVETKRVKAQAAYSQWRADVDQRDAFMDPDAERPETILPRHQLLARVDLDLRKDLELDVLFRMLSARPAVDVDGYLEADARVSWCPWKSLWLTAVGQNLLMEHVEGGENPVTASSALEPTEIPRSFYLQLEWRK